MDKVALSLTPRRSSFWKGSLWVTLDKGCQIYLLYLYKDGFAIE